MKNDRSWIPRSPDREFDLLTTPEDDMYHEAGGAYVLLVRTRWQFPYPLQRSRVLYIGMSGPESERLASHRSHALQARAEIEEADKFDSYWKPRHAYAAKYGAKVWWFATRGTQTPETLEASLVDAFYWHAGAIPIANGQWPNG